MHTHRDTSMSAQRQQSLMPTLLQFFSTTPDAAEFLLAVVGQRHSLSLRLLDWFVTSFTRRTPVIYYFNDLCINVHLAYKGHLRAYSKKAFDPFCRRDRVYIRVAGFHSVDGPGDGILETTCGQLNFFKWAYTCGVLAYCECNIESIEKDLDSHAKGPKDKKKTKPSSTYHAVLPITITFT